MNPGGVKEWFSPSELAGLPGMPASERQVRNRARRHGWTARDRNAKGGGREYHLHSLPEETRVHIATQQHQVEDEAAKAGREVGRKARAEAAVQRHDHREIQMQGMAAAAAMTGRDRQRIDARYAVINAVYRLRQSGVGGRRSVELIAGQYNRGELELDEEARSTLGPDISVASIYRWIGLLENKGLTALAGRYGQAETRSSIASQPDLLRFCEAMLYEHPHASPKHLHRSLQTRFRDRADIKLPAMRSTQRWLKEYRRKNREVLEAIADPDGWKNKYMLAFGSASEGIERINQLWELDSTPADVMLADGRHSIIGILDVATRRGRLLVSKTSTATAVASATRRALLDWGAPEVAKTDNGSDYVSHHMTQVFERLGVEQQLCPPFQPWKKPHIERFFGTFAHDLVELLPGYIGHDVAERQSIEARKSFADRIMKRGEVIEVRMTGEQFQAFCNDWVERIYHHAAHDGLGGQTPFEAEQSAPGVIRRVSDERGLDALLAQAPGDGMRTVRKKGIKLDHGWYIAPELGEIPGERVHVRYDETDYGLIYVYYEGRFWCIAEDPAARGVSRQDVATEAKARQVKRVQEERRRLREQAKAEKARDIAQEILQEAKTPEQVTPFPRASEDHESNGLTAAGEAADAREAIDRPAQTPVVDEAAIGRVTELLRDEQQQDETAEDRFRRWIDLHEREAAGESLCETDIAWRSRYEDTSEFRGRHLIYEDYGASVFGVGKEKGPR